MKTRNTSTRKGNRKGLRSFLGGTRNLLLTSFLLFGIILAARRPSLLDITSYDTTNGNGISVALAYKQSFGLFDDITDTMWKRMRDSAQKKSLYANPENPLLGVEEEKTWLANNLNPTFNCPHVERVGAGEGVKYLCYPHRLAREEKKDCLVYSIGCAGDFHFEDAMSKKYDKECEIHIFDPANWERANDAEAKNIHYHPWGMLSTYDDKSKSVVWPKGRGGGFKTFQESIELLGHQDRTVDIFKIDCEGCEWSTYKDWIGFGKSFSKTGLKD